VMLLVLFLQVVLGLLGLLGLQVVLLLVLLLQVVLGLLGLQVVLLVLLLQVVLGLLGLLVQVVLVLLELLGLQVVLLVLLLQVLKVLLGLVVVMSRDVVCFVWDTHRGYTVTVAKRFSPANSKYKPVMWTAHASGFGAQAAIIINCNEKRERADMPHIRAPPSTSNSN